MSSDFDEIWYICLYGEKNIRIFFLGLGVDRLTREGSDKIGRFRVKIVDVFHVLVHNSVIYWDRTLSDSSF